jgi:hypothetical protein
MSVYVYEYTNLGIFVAGRVGGPVRQEKVRLPVPIKVRRGVGSNSVAGWNGPQHFAGDVDCW